MIPKIRQLAGYLVAGLLLCFLIKPFVQTQTTLKYTSFQLHWHWLIPAFGLHILYRIYYTVPFATLLRCLMQKPVSFRDAFTLFHLANITRYLPGRIWGVVRLLSLSEQFRLSKTAVGSSLTLHVGVETALGGLIALSLLFSKQMQDTATQVLDSFSGQTVFLMVAGIGLMMGILFCIPKLAARAGQFLKKCSLLLKNTLLWRIVLTSHIGLWICQGLAFFLFVRSFALVRWADVWGLAACFAFAWIIGFFSFLTPGGLGVREGLLGLLLANYLPTYQATLVALLCRLCMLSAEVLLAGTAWGLHKRRYKRNNQGQDF